jgi:hypothetical protein
MTKLVEPEINRAPSMASAHVGESWERTLNPGCVDLVL